MSDASDHELDRWVGELVADAVADAPEAPDLSTLAAGEAGGSSRARWGWFGAVAAAGAAAAVIALVFLPGMGDEAIREIEPAETPPISTEPDPPATTVDDSDPGRTTAPGDTSVPDVEPGVVPGPDPEPVAPLAVRDDDVPTFVERLAMIPDHAPFRNEVLFADIDVATEIAGLERPDAGDDEAVLAWYSTITGGQRPAASGVEALSVGPMWLGAHATVDDPDPTRELGIDLTELAWSAHSNMFPQFAVTGGRVDPERVRDAADDELDGILRFGRNNWFQPDMEQATQLSIRGLPIAVGFAGDTMLLSTDPDLVRQALDRDIGTLADVDAFRAAAEVLDINGAYSARLFSNTEQPSSVGSTLDAVGTGLIVTATGDRQVLLVIVADPSTAEAAVELAVDRIDRGTFSLTGEPWRDMFDVRSTMVDGGVGIVRLDQQPDTRVPSFFLEELLYELGAD